MKSSLKKSLAEIRENQRLRLGMAAIVAVLALFSILEWSDAIRGREARYKKASRELNTLSSAVGTAAKWEKRMEEMRTLEHDLAARQWEYGSLAAAQAGTEDWFREMARKAYLPSMEIRPLSSDISPLGEKSAEASKTQKLKYSLSFNFSAPALEGMLVQLYGSPKVVAIERMAVKKQGNVEMTVAVPVYVSSGVAVDTLKK